MLPPVIRSSSLSNRTSVSRRLLSSQYNVLGGGGGVRGGYKEGVWGGYKVGVWGGYKAGGVGWV